MNRTSSIDKALLFMAGALALVSFINLLAGNWPTALMGFLVSGVGLAGATSNDDTPSPL